MLRRAAAAARALGLLQLGRPVDAARALEPLLPAGGLARGAAWWGLAPAAGGGAVAAAAPAAWRTFAAGSSAAVRRLRRAGARRAGAPPNTVPPAREIEPACAAEPAVVPREGAVTCNTLAAAALNHPALIITRPIEWRAGGGGRRWARGARAPGCCCSAHHGAPGTAAPNAHPPSPRLPCHARRGTVLVGFEQANRYTVCDERGAVVALLAEEEGSLGRALGRQLLRTRRAFVATVFSPDGAAGGGAASGERSCGRGSWRRAA